MSERKDAVLPDLDSPRPANRREFLGKTAVAAAAAAGIPALLAACGESATASTATRGATPAAPRASLGGGRDPGVTLHSMMVATLGHATDVSIPALEKGTTTKYLQRVVTDTDRTGTGLATILKSSYSFAGGTTVQVVVQDGHGRVWSPRTISKQSDLVYAMKDALATNPTHVGVLRESLTVGKPVVAISNSSVVQFQDSVASDFYGNHLDLVSRGMSDVFNTSVSGIKLASTMRDFSRC